jgi:hypothetical protein
MLADPINRLGIRMDPSVLAETESGTSRAFMRVASPSITVMPTTVPTFLIPKRRKRSTRYAAGNGLAPPDALARKPVAVELEFGVGAETKIWELSWLKSSGNGCAVGRGPRWLCELGRSDFNRLRRRGRKPRRQGRVRTACNATAPAVGAGLRDATRWSSAHSICWRGTGAA